MIAKWRSLYFNPRVLMILALGFASGLPLVLIGSTLQIWYSKAGVSLMTVGVLSLVGQPYVWKVFWAPILDRYSLFHLGRRRGWIVLLQICVAVTLFFIAIQSPKTHPWLLGVLALIVAFFSASQDTAIDAYRTDLLPEGERGAGAAMYSLGYRLAMLVAGALAVILASQYGWRATYFLMAGIMFLCAFISLKSPSAQYEKEQPQTLKKAVLEPWREFLKRPGVKVILIFIVTYKLTDALALSLNSFFLVRYLHFSLMALGKITKIAGMTGVILGSIIGGALYQRIGLYRSLLYFGVLQALSALLFAVLTLAGKNYIVMAISVFGENFCSALSSVAFIVYLTSLCNTRYTATQYALFSAISAVGRVYVGPVAAALVKHIGWFDFYIVSCLVGFFPLFILWKYLEREPRVPRVYSSL